MLHLDHVRLLVVDFDACFRFYRDIMGLRVTWGEEKDAYASYVSEGGASLSLFKREVQTKALGTSNLPESAVAQDRMALIFAVDDLDATVKKLKGILDSLLSLKNGPIGVTRGLPERP